MIYKLKLTQGKYAIVDKSSFDALRKYKWCYSNGYAYRHARKQWGANVSMHREVMGLIPHDGKQIDHINGNKLDNRKSNLRLCNYSQNQIAKGLQINNTSGYKGVVKSKAKNKFDSRIFKSGKWFYLGCFHTPRSAAIAYNKKARELFGEFAYQNKI